MKHSRKKKVKTINTVYFVINIGNMTSRFARQPANVPKDTYYVLKRSIQNTFYSVINEDSHSKRRAIVAFRTKEHAQQFKQLYVGLDVKLQHKKELSKNIQPHAIDTVNLKILCDLAAMDCVCFAPDLDHSFCKLLVRLKII